MGRKKKSDRRLFTFRELGLRPLFDARQNRVHIRVQRVIRAAPEKYILPAHFIVPGSLTMRDDRVDPGKQTRPPAVNGCLRRLQRIESAGGHETFESLPV